MPISDEQLKEQVKKQAPIFYTIGIILLITILIAGSYYAVTNVYNYNNISQNISNTYLNASGQYYIFFTDTMIQNVTFNTGILSLSTCDLNYSGGLLVQTSCGNGSTLTAMGITNTYTFYTNISLILGTLSIDDCTMKFINGQLNESTCS